jgi:phage terminase small subunit
MMNPKRERFVAEYLVDLNATQAAIRAGYSPRTALQQGPRLLGDAGVQAAIRAGKGEALERTNLKADRVLRELGRVAFSDVRHLFTDDGGVIALRELPPAVSASIASVEVVLKNAAAGDGVVDRVLKIKLWDKNRALNDLARHFALLVDRVEVSGDVTLTAKIAAARARGAKLLKERNGGGGE